MKKFLKYSIFSFVPLALAYDYSTDEKVIFRNLRTIRCGINILYSYKIKFNADNAEQIHEDIAHDIYNVCLQNDGLYVKFGQGMASFDHLLPPAYFKWLSLLQDKAKQVPYSKIKNSIESDLNKSIEEIFEFIDEKAIASASIAQVHKAVLKSGEQVAVKVQKPNIQKQFSADMFMHWIICAVLEYAFDLPLLQFQQEIELNLAKEIDFRIELENGEHIRYGLNQCNRKDVYIPKMYKNISTQRVLVSEWIDGIKITHTNEIEALGLSTKKALQTVIDCFAEQIFVTGFIHCDPHPGNIFVRRNPNNSKLHQIVLLDFGLCIKISNQFRLQYAQFWKALFIQDRSKMKSILQQWGINNEELFASMQLMRPYKNNKPLHQKITKDDVLQMQFKMKEDVRKLMREADQFPQELLFVNRNMNLVRSANKKCGSQVNRINVMARFASIGCGIPNDILINFRSNEQYFCDTQKKQSHKSQLINQINQMYFETRLFFNNLLYKIVNFWVKFSGKKGFEDLIDQKQKQAMYEMYGSYGFKVPDENTFDA